MRPIYYSSGLSVLLYSCFWVFLPPSPAKSPHRAKHPVCRRIVGIIFWEYAQAGAVPRSGNEILHPTGCPALCLAYLVPHAGRQVLGRPWHDGDVEDGLVAAALQLPQDEHVVVLVHQMLARFPSPSRIWIKVEYIRAGLKVADEQLSFSI